MCVCVLFSFLSDNALVHYVIVLINNNKLLLLLISINGTIVSTSFIVFNQQPNLVTDFKITIYYYFAEMWEIITVIDNQKKLKEGPGTLSIFVN